jgi:hypothetical protein
MSGNDQIKLCNGSACQRSKTARSAYPHYFPINILFNLFLSNDVEELLTDCEVPQMHYFDVPQVCIFKYFRKSRLLQINKPLESILSHGKSSYFPSDLDDHTILA